MKKRIICSVILVLLIAFSMFSVSYGSSGNGTTIEEYEKMTAETLMKTICDISRETNNINALIDPSVVLESKITSKDKDSLTTLIKSDSTNEMAKYALIEISGYLGEDEELTAIYNSYLNDTAKPDSLRQLCVWMLEENNTLLNKLKSIIEQENGGVAGQALKRLYEMDREYAIEKSREIVFNDKLIDTSLSTEAIRRIGINISKFNKKDRELIKERLFSLLDTTQDEEQALALFYAIAENSDIIEQSKLLEYDMIDDETKFSWFNANEEDQLSVLKQDPSVEQVTAISKIAEYSDSEEVKEILEKRGNLTDRASAKANQTYQHRGYAVYNDGNWYNIDYHAGLLLYNKTDTNKCVLHKYTTDNKVKLTTWSVFMGNTDFKCLCRPKGSLATFESKINNIVSYGNQLRNQSIVYVLGKQIVYTSNPDGTTYYKPSDITKIRCDGVVEYCYERNGLKVYAPASDTSKWNVSKISNNAYGHGGISVTPQVQCLLCLNTVTTNEGSV